jgi:hypothetical protein
MKPQKRADASKFIQSLCYLLLAIASAAFVCSRMNVRPEYRIVLFVLFCILAVGFLAISTRIRDDDDHDDGEFHIEM